MFRSNSRHPAAQMIVLATLLALISGALMISTHAKTARGITVMTSSPFAFPDPSQKTSSSIQTTMNAIAAFHNSGKAPVDAPLPNGPGPIFWSDGDSTYRAAHVISVWDTQTQSWQQLSPDLTEDKTVGAPGYGVDGITSVAHHQGVWYVGTLAGQLTTQAPGRTWAIIQGGLPKRTITSIAILPGNAAGQVAVLGYGGYGTATPDAPGHVYITHNGGNTWTDVTGNLPDAPVQSLHFSTSNTTEILSVEVGGHWYIMQKPGRWAALR